MSKELWYISRKASLAAEEHLVPSCLKIFQICVCIMLNANQIPPPQNPQSSPSLFLSQREKNSGATSWERLTHIKKVYYYRWQPLWYISSNRCLNCRHLDQEKVSLFLNPSNFQCPAACVLHLPIFFFNFATPLYLFIYFEMDHQTL